MPALREALAGRFRPAHAFLLGQILAKIDFLEETLAALSAHIEVLLAPFDSALAHLMTIPGVKRRTAETIIAETGGDMRHFPTDAQLCSWTGICPGQDESAGKRRSGKMRKGNHYLRPTVNRERMGRQSRRRDGPASTLSARETTSRSQESGSGHRASPLVLVMAYHVLARDMTYQELGADYFDRQHRDRAIRRHVKQLEHLGYRVTLEPPAA